MTDQPTRVSLADILERGFDAMGLANSKEMAEALMGEIAKQCVADIRASGVVKDEATIRADERERCARVAEDLAAKVNVYWCDLIAAAIRERSR